MSSRLNERLRGLNFLTWIYLGLLLFVLVVWAWSTGWRTYFVVEDIPNLVLVILCLIFIYWLDARPRG